LLADTTFVIDVMSNDRSALEKAKELENSGIPILIGSPSIFELFVGVALSKKPLEERAKIASVLESLPQLPFDFSSASSAGAIYGEKIKTGSQIDPEDAMIAGIAKTNNQKILTRNAKHFCRIEGVEVEKY
jgi:tRNA(fMet)-specific endonuclease VapC